MTQPAGDQLGAVDTAPGCLHPDCVLSHPHAGPAVLPPAYGSATVTRHADGRIEITHADRVIGIAVEYLADVVDRFPVDDSGAVLLAGDPRYRYRPVRFASPFVLLAGGPARVLVLERVDAPGR